MAYEQPFESAEPAESTEHGDTAAPKRSGPRLRPSGKQVRWILIGILLAAVAALGLHDQLVHHRRQAAGVC